MKLFMKKTLVVMLAVIITSLFVKGIIQVGDTVITQETSKNYNGYLPLQTENTLIELGADIIDSYENYVIYGLYNLEYQNQTVYLPGPFLILDDNIGQYVKTYLVTVIHNENETYIQIYTENGYINMTYMFIEIMGISNYEVQP